MSDSAVRNPDRGEVLLGLIYDEVDQRLNPNNDECWYCGGEGATYDCIDGCCIDAESGCPDCYRPCIECRINKAMRAKAVREEVIKANDPEIAVAWLKDVRPLARRDHRRADQGAACRRGREAGEFQIHGRRGAGGEGFHMNTQPRSCRTSFAADSEPRERLDPICLLLWIGIPLAWWILAGMILYRVLA